jgi:hypothetical protein
MVNMMQYRTQLFKVFLNLKFTLYRAIGGRDAEREERQKWDSAEQKKIMDSVNGSLYFFILFICFFLVYKIYK